MSVRDIDLHKLLETLLSFEEDRLRTLGVSIKDAEARLGKAELLPKQLSVRAANYLAELMSYQSEDANPAFSQPKGPGMTRHPTIRLDGKGMSREFIESKFTEFVEFNVREMIRVLGSIEKDKEREEEKKVEEKAQVEKEKTFSSPPRKKKVQIKDKEDDKKVKEIKQVFSES